MIALQIDGRPAIGTPCYSRNLYGDRRGYVAGVTDYEGGKRYTIGAGGMKEIPAYDVRVVFDDVTETSVSAEMAAEWIQKAADLGMTGESPDRVAEMLAAARAASKARQDAAERERQAAADAAAAFRNQYRDKIPADAVAVILATLEQDDCDIQSDYFNVKSTRTVILGFSTHTRDLFPELRKAARNFTETAHLADAPATAEHREKYSMGAGYYLKSGNRYDSGWKVHKRSFYLPAGSNDRAAALPFGEWSVPEATDEPKAEPRARRSATDDPAKAQTAAETVNGMTISEHVHTKNGFTFYIVQDGERVARSVFDSRLQQAKGGRGWYSRAWAGTPGGFAFKDRAAAVKFAEGLRNV